MKILYIANIRLPTEKAHGIQIMKMCEAFAHAGAEVELPRNSVDSSTTFSQFRGKLSRAIDWYTALKSMANRTPSYRYE